MQLTNVRPAAVAGSWYPGTPARLGKAIDEHLAAADPPPTPLPRAIVVPHAGLIYSGPVAAFAYKAAAQGRYRAIVLVGPSHFVGFPGVSIWPRGSWNTPLGPIPVASELAHRIMDASSAVVEHQAAHAREHSLEMQLPFVARLLADTPIVPLVMGYQTRATAEALGDAVAKAITVAGCAAGGEDVLLVASSDLSHYEDAATASQMDGVVLQHVERLDPDGLMDALEREPRHACGGGPIVAVLRAALALGGSHARVLHYADSGDVSGDKSSVVGYMAAAIW